MPSVNSKDLKVRWSKLTSADSRVVKTFPRQIPSLQRGHDPSTDLKARRTWPFIASNFIYLSVDHVFRLRGFQSPLIKSKTRPNAPAASRERLPRRGRPLMQHPDAESEFFAIYLNNTQVPSARNVADVGTNDYGYGVVSSLCVHGINSRHRGEGWDPK